MMEDLEIAFMCRDLRCHKRLGKVYYENVSVEKLNLALSVTLDVQKCFRTEIDRKKFSVEKKQLSELTALVGKILVEPARVFCIP